MKRFIFLILFVLSSICIYAQTNTTNPWGNLFGFGYYYNRNHNYVASYGIWSKYPGYAQGQLNFEYTKHDNTNFYSLGVQGDEGGKYFFASPGGALQTDFKSAALKLRLMLGAMYKGYVKVGYSFSVNIPHAIDGSSHHAIHAYIYLFGKNKR